ncbi:MAG: NDP-sugar synthase [Lachnospiraceae bacterium]
MKQIALVIMAAGIGSRFGEGIKQLAAVGPNDEIIMDYSIHDAIEAGFNKVIFIIRKDIEEIFEEVIGKRIRKVVDVAYAFQDGDDLPEGFTRPEGRTKPWGTGQAVLAARNLIDCPFVVINADDYYGKEGFRKLHDFLIQNEDTTKYCMAGFILGNTLSENGAVTRGVCELATDGTLANITETAGIKREGDRIICERDGKTLTLDENSHVSMNMWGFHPDFIQKLEKDFITFLQNVPEGDLKAEYLLPMVVDDAIKAGEIKVEVLETQDKWFGVTYAEDKPKVVESFQRLVEEGVYQSPLF